MKKISLLFLSLTLFACSRTVGTPSDLSGKAFPRVIGENLAKETVVIPDSLKGKVAVLLVGYKQNAQFDIDRWILGLLQAEVPAQIVELPTIAGMAPQVVQGFINGGMRGGIPKEDWASVVTIYGDASKIIEAIGNESPQNAHVVLLDQTGQIVWSANRGYSATQVLELKKIAQSLVSPAV